MRAKFIVEGAEFKRGADPIRTIGIGKNPIQLNRVYYYGDSNWASLRKKLTYKEIKYLLNNWYEEIDGDYEFIVQNHNKNVFIWDADDMEDKKWIEYKGNVYKIVD
jgi:hypothetical protein